MCEPRASDFFLFYYLFYSFLLSLRFALRSHYVTSVTAATLTLTAHQRLLRCCCCGLQISNIFVNNRHTEKKAYTIYIYIYIDIDGVRNKTVCSRVFYFIICEIYKYVCVCLCVGPSCSN